MKANNTTTIEVIGSVEFINLPEQKISGIPARVDTGAIYSSIWASEIKVKNGTLSFKLFAPGNTLYNGEAIKTKNFRTSSVKSSFGQTEFRYKVSLVCTLGDRRIKAWFTLANRSGMTYPVLIGRNILRNKYVVDVSQNKTKRKHLPKEVLVLATNAHDFDNFFHDVAKKSKQKTNYMLRDYKELAFYIRPGSVKLYETKTNRDLGSFDLVYFKSHKRDYATAIAVAQYLQFMGIKVLDKELLTHLSYDKLSEYMRLALHNIPVPKTFCTSTDYILKHQESVAAKVGWPLVCKEINADKGKKNYLVSNPEELKEILMAADKKDTYLIQQYIPNDGFIRALVFDRDVALAIHRSPIERDDKLKSHLNKIPNSDNITKIKLSELDALVHDLSVRASVIMNRQIAGVDLIQDKKSMDWFILEVNNAPQIASGPLLEERKQAVAQFIDEELVR